MSIEKKVKCLVALVIALGISIPLAAAQESRQQTNTAPPPLRVIPPADRELLKGLRDHKDRVKKSIELAETHLSKAEGFTTQEQYSDASAEMGRYWALLEDTFQYLSPLNRDSGKTRDLYKRLELALRAHGIRLALLRRVTPVEYAIWIKQLEEYARNGRTEALNSFYGTTVVRDSKQKPKAGSSNDKRAADNSPPPESRQP